MHPTATSPAAVAGGCVGAPGFVVSCDGVTSQHTRLYTHLLLQGVQSVGVGDKGAVDSGMDAGHEGGMVAGFATGGGGCCLHCGLYLSGITADGVDLKCCGF